MGLTRRMVDVYLLCLAQQGVIRISQARGGWIDRSTISSIDFKPDTLRGMSRIELPRALDDWEVFHPYLEVLTDTPGHLGPKYDKAAADDALKLFWEKRWIGKKAVEDNDRDIQQLFEALGQRDTHPFDDLLIYWLDFSDEPRPEPYSDEDVYQWLRRTVVRIGEVSNIEDLNDEHFTKFRNYYRQWTDLDTSFTQTSPILLKAAKLSSAPLPDGNAYREIANAQENVRKELEHCKELMLNPDGVNTRLAPRMSQLENPFVESYLSELMRLDSIQGQLRELLVELASASELDVLNDFASEVEEAKRSLEEAKQVLSEAPTDLRRSPEDRDRAEKEVRREARVKDLEGQDLTLRRLTDEADARLKAQAELAAVPGTALKDFASFLLSPGIRARLSAIEKPSKELQELREIEEPTLVGECLQTLPRGKRQELAKLLKLVVGKRRVKAVSLKSFRPPIDIVWDKNDLDCVVKGFEDFLQKQYDDESYLRME